MDRVKQDLLRGLPSVDSLMQTEEMAALVKSYRRWHLLDAVRAELEAKRQEILSITAPDQAEKVNISPADILTGVKRRVALSSRPSLCRVINATGVVIHTNLGRSLLGERVLEHIREVGDHYTNLEFDLERGERGHRWVHVERLLRRLSGAESALVVNNNAAAVLLACDTLAKGREIIVSRGEMIEIGGSFRIPEVIEKGGGILREVGTTNRTHLRDYAAAINENTGMILKVHPSNYRVVGFTAEVSPEELAALGRETGIPVVEDLGSGNFYDFSRGGMGFHEPMVSESVQRGMDVVTFSGDKLLGGPQAGIMVGRGEYIESFKKNPLHRALRVDKFSIAALEITLTSYMDPETVAQEIPTLRMIAAPLEEVRLRAERLLSMIKGFMDGRAAAEVIEDVARVGGGALPLVELPTAVVAIRPLKISPGELEEKLRRADPPVICRICRDMVHLDMRTVQDDDIPLLASIFENGTAWLA